MKFTENLVI